jgi:hypothetical protein
MQEMMVLWATSYAGVGFSESVKSELLRMSHATIDRLLKPYRAEYWRRVRSGTSPAKIKNCIPIRAFDRNVTSVGYVEADTVAHCGESMSGEFLWSLCVVDRLSGWTEVRGVWNKLAKEVVSSLQDIESRLFFVVKGISTDNGTEFLNRELLKYVGKNPTRQSDIFLTRSRPYKKNDQCYVEQKNYTHVRKLLGYDRLDCPEVKELVNDLYRNEWSDLQNYFYPQMKLIEKIRVGAKYKRKYDRPKTPHRRLMENPNISEEAKQKMQEKFNSMNPFELSATVKKKLKRIWEVQSNFERGQKTLEKPTLRLITSE